MVRHPVLDYRQLIGFNPTCSVLRVPYIDVMATRQLYTASIIRRSLHKSRRERKTCQVSKRDKEETEVPPLSRAASRREAIDEIVAGAEVSEHTTRGRQVRRRR